MESLTVVLRETGGGDFARLAFGTSTTPFDWHIAAFTSPSASASALNFWYEETGDVVQIFGDGRMWLRSLPAHSSANTLCASTSSGSAIIGRCSSSQRYKTDIQSFEPGLEIVERLRSVSFTSVSSGERDLGFIAEEVAKVHPLLATYDEKGRPESVRYMELTAVLSNAIQQQQRTIRDQQRKVDDLEALVRNQQQLIEENTRAMRALADAVASVRSSREN